MTVLSYWSALIYTYILYIQFRPPYWNTVIQLTKETALSSSILQPADANCNRWKRTAMAANAIFTQVSALGLSKDATSLSSASSISLSTQSLRISTISPVSSSICRRISCQANSSAVSSTSAYVNGKGEVHLFSLLIKTIIHCFGGLSWKELVSSWGI